MVRIPTAKPGARIDEKTTSDHCNDSGTRVLTIDYHRPPHHAEQHPTGPRHRAHHAYQCPPPHQAPHIH
ncbi:hypothetical protein BJV77DRAFT_1042406, partial [Russula vinacea]